MEEQVQKLSVNCMTLSSSDSLFQVQVAGVNIVSINTAESIRASTNLILRKPNISATINGTFVNKYDLDLDYILNPTQQQKDINAIF